MTELITVEPGPVSKVQVEPTEVNLGIGETESFSFSAVDQFGNQVTGFLSSWSVPTKLGTIDSKGKLTAGTKSGDYPGVIRLDLVRETSRASASADLAIRPDSLATIKVEPSSIELVEGGAKQFTATGSDKYGNVIPDLAFLWETAGGDIGQDGYLTAPKVPGNYRVDVSAIFEGSTTIGSATVEVLEGFSPPLGLVAQWSGDGNANDAIGDNHGTLGGGASFAPGMVGQAFYFDGANDFVEVSDTANLDITGTITLAAWIKTSGTNDHSGILDKMIGFGPATGYRLGVDPNSKFRCDIIKARPPQGTVVSTTAVEDGDWHHVACTYDGATIKVYVDGRFEAEASYTDGIGLNDEALLIGWDDDKYQNTRHFNGLIDEVAIFNRPLSAAEIKSIYDAGSSGMVKPPPGPVAWWSGEGNANYVVGGNQGTIRGDVTFVPGVIGQAFSFERSNGHVELPASGSLDRTGDGLTVVTWINPLVYTPATGRLE